MSGITALTTGGSLDKTYCGKASDFIVSDPTLVGILGDANCTHEVALVEMCRKDSLALNDDDREQLRLAVQASPHSRILITHGTDTMWLTAHALLQTAKDAGKTVVLTGAMKPASFKDSDGPFNVGFATACLQLLPPGAHVCMSGEAFSKPLRIRKDFERNVFYEVGEDRSDEEVATASLGSPGGPGGGDAASSASSVAAKATPLASGTDRMTKLTVAAILAASAALAVMLFVRPSLPSKITTA